LPTSGNSDLRNELIAIVGTDAATFSPHHNLEDLHDETLHPVRASLSRLYAREYQQVVDIAKLASEFKVPSRRAARVRDCREPSLPYPAGLS